MTHIDDHFDDLHVNNLRAIPIARSPLDGSRSFPRREPAAAIYVLRTWLSSEDLWCSSSRQTCLCNVRLPQGDPSTCIFSGKAPFRPTVTYLPNMELNVSKRACRLSTRSFTTVPLFLAPAFASQAPSTLSLRFYSISPSQQAQKIRHRDKNKNRGVSAIRRTGLRYPLSMSNYELPKPVLDRKPNNVLSADTTHGLWGFFNSERQAVLSRDSHLHGNIITLPS